MSRAVAAWVICLTSLALTGAGMVLLALVPADRAPGGERLIDVLPYASMTVSFATVGVLVSLRRPANPIGWLLLAAGAWNGFQYFTSGYAVFGLFGGAGLPGARVAGWLFSWSSATGPLVVATVVFLFPDGRFALYRSRIGFALGLCGTVTGAVAFAFIPGPLLNLKDVENPFGLTGQEALVTALSLVSVSLILAAVALMVSTVYARYQVAVTTEQLQFKWFATGVGVAVLLMLVSGPLVLVNWGWAKVGFTSAVSLIPIAIGIAILRARLYDIDLVINRALVYGATTALIAAAFFGGIVVLQSVLRPLTGGSEAAVAVSTLTSVALAQPLRRRIQDAVDRRFDRSRYDAARTLERFTARLGDEVDLDALRSELLGVVGETMAPAHASVWLRRPAR